MALDGIFLHHIKTELEKEAIGARVSQIYQPNKDELVIGLRTQNGNKKLLLSSRANSPRVHFTEYAPENPAVPPMLCMLLRKRLGGGKLISVRQPDLERILFLDFEAVNELGDKVQLTVATEIMGKYSNIIIINGDGVIIDSLKRVDMTMSSQRLVLPNLKYELPPAQDKLSILNSSADEIIKKIKALDRQMPLNKALLAVLQGTSPVVCREIEHKTSVLSKADFDITNFNMTAQIEAVLIEQLNTLSDIAKNSSGTPYMIYRNEDNGKPFDMSFMQIRQYEGGATVKCYESFSRLADDFYAERDKADRMKIKAADLYKLLTNTMDRLSRKINLQSAELDRCKNREQLRIFGDLLQANLYRIEKGSESVAVQNFYDENMAEITIPLNPAISPASNAQKYYKDYRKAKTAEKMLTQQIEKAKDELDYIDATLDCVSRAESEKDLAQIRLELIEQGYIKAPKGKQKPPAALPPMEFTSSDGFKILVGRNNKQNDKLTLKTANKNDVWFHTKDIHGSHTIVVTDGREITETAILEAAQTAAYFSKARESSQVPVDYTLVRFVSKPSGAKPGMVIYVNNSTVYVTPKIIGR
ncbi:MAG: NFACT family protein [Acutalibacteraceae bacterium]